MTNQKWFRIYIFIWSGQFISMLSSYAVHFAIIIWLSLEFKSAEILAYAAIAAMLPQALIGPFAGVFIDRWNRKKVMIYADAFLASTAIIMSFILQSEKINLNWIYILLGFRSIGNAFHSPAMQAIAPLLVPQNELLRVSGINQMLQSGSTIAGPALGTLAIVYLPISKVLYLDVIGAVVAILSLLFVQIPYLKAETSSTVHSVFREMKGGFNAVLHHKGLSFLFLYAMMVTAFIMPAAILFPLLTTGHYKGGKWEMSIIEIVWGIGMLIGGTILGIFKVQYSKVMMINTMYIILGLSFILCGLFPGSWFIEFAAATMLGGIALSIFSASFNTILQVEVEPGKLGRVFSLYYSLTTLPSLIGLLFTGFIAQKIGIINAFYICGGLVSLIGLISMSTSSLKGLGAAKGGR